MLQSLRYRASALQCLITAIAATIALSAGPALAQSAACTLKTIAGSPALKLLSCSSGAVVKAEATTRFNVVESGGRAEAIVLKSGAVLTEFPSGGTRRGFQIRTPHAIAAVRGTRWAVDVTAAKTSVFVVRGSVRVAARDARPAVTLRAGDGVDVAAGDPGPLAVTRWKRPRIEALLSRLGR
jgi:ferric-dicitrate binding protein FerR (iron transport regulator)